MSSAYLAAGVRTAPPEFQPRPRYVLAVPAHAVRQCAREPPSLGARENAATQKNLRSARGTSFSQTNASAASSGRGRFGQPGEIDADTAGGCLAYEGCANTG